MRIIIEEYKYAAADVKDVLKGIDALENVEGYVSVNYVGYFYNTDESVRDCVFILPKVLLEVGDDKEELVFGKYRPEDIINLDAHNPLTQQEKDFIYEFAVWIYRSIVVFHNDKRNQTSIVYHKKIAEVGKGGRHLSNTFLDILLSLVQFNKENQNFFFFVLRNLHAGFNKINWTRTIATTDAIVQGKDAIYLRPVNKKRQINFDEELLVIFFSILNYISEHYGFPVTINCNFQLITGKQFKTYLNGMGKVRLRQIKYKYFSDKALQLWDLCYAFFDTARQVYVSTEQKEYLLVKNFNIVFEAIIDELVGDRNIPAGLKEQDDGKRIDHMYSYQGLTTHDEDKPIYYIGDSKYYKRGNQVGKESVYKQFTYARNVIQWNLNLFMNDDRDDAELQYDKKNFGNIPKLRDDVTEGYNVIPNFFISAKLNKDLSYKDEVEVTDKKKTHFENTHFDNRLFDRDTLLICHYDVNFLYVISLYARNNSLQKDAWKKNVREKFRSEIQRMLTEKYSFYAMQAHPNVDAKAYLKEHFQQTLGKIYTPFGTDEVFSLALDKQDPEGNNEALLAELRKHFYVEKCGIGIDPHTVLPAVEGQATLSLPPDDYVLVGCTRADNHRNWVFTNGKYNIRLDMGTGVEGAVRPTHEYMSVSHLIIYKEDERYVTEIYNMLGSEKGTPEFANYDRMKALKYPFNIKRLPSNTYEQRAYKKYNNRVYMFYNFDVVPNKLENGMAIDLAKLILENTTEETPVGTPILIKVRDLNKYIVTK
ncbi:restriction endonuclease [Sodaliphilus sp.]|uniref:restriction endonuclease n=1 Tax=Sodaliphilus sp. TaxID=2815818 RepID=UPI00388E2540